MSSVPATSERPFRRVAVVGLGVMGGSLCRDLSAAGGVEVRGWSPQEGEREAARAAGAVDAAPDTLEEAVAGVELVVLAAPLKATLALLPRVAREAPGAALTDVASLKGPVAAAVRAAGHAARWVGSHPMAGSQASGFGASRAGLYRGATVWLVCEDEGRRHLPSVEALWRGVGGEPSLVEAQDHDRLMALASHLPQLVANGLASVLEDRGVLPRDLGPGGRDMTRLAASSTAMWRDLLDHAPRDLPAALHELSATLRTMAAALEEGRVAEVAAVMDRTRQWKAGPTLAGGAAPQGRGRASDATDEARNGLDPATEGTG